MKSPELVFIVTSFKLISVRTDVNLTLQSLKCVEKLRSRARERRTPFFLDHFKKIAMVNNALKDRAKRKTIMAIEGRREADDRDRVLKYRRYEGRVGMFHIRMEMG